MVEGVDPRAPVVGGVDSSTPVVGGVAHCGPATAGGRHIVGQAATGTRNALLQKISISNGKSSIVEERLHSFFFALKKKRSFVFSFFLFYSIRNEDVRFASIF